MGLTMQTLAIFLWNCPVVKVYWQNIRREIVCMIKQDICITDEYILLGKIPSGVVEALLEY